MALAPGTRLGPYEIEVPLGAGGMGEVYRAKDTRLDRTVAVKMLPAQVSKDPHLQKRFEREARALAGLSHPRICTLHDVGHERGVRFLVMELVKGETLAARLKRGALPLDQAIDVGIQIAEALDVAHRRGIVHRDVKPGNIMLTKDGIKLLDFGLARDTSPPCEPAPTATSETATVQAAITSEGAIIGTLSYMAPEQLEGREADARSDLFAVGSVLYETTTGAAPFRGTSQAGLIASILTGEPGPMTERQPQTPAPLSRAVSRCLAKEPDSRWQSARDLMLELQWIASGEGIEAKPEPTVPRGVWRERIAWALLLVLFVTMLTMLARPRPAPTVPPVTRLSLALPEGASSPFACLSPDGRTLAIDVFAGGQRRIWLRPLDSLSSRPLPGTEGTDHLFWSPDGHRIGFFADGKLKTIDIRGGPPHVLCDAPGAFSMGTWSSDGTILFSILEAPGQDGVYRVSEAGGTPTKLTILDESDRALLGAWPSFLPDGRHFLFTCGIQEHDDTIDGGLCLAALDSGRASLMLRLPMERGSRAEYAEPGYLVYTREGALLAQAFDPDERVVTGEPVTLAERIQAMGPLGMDNFSVSGDVLVYQTESNRSELIWKDRNGRTVGRVGVPGAYSDVSLRSDGAELAMVMRDPQDGQGNVWIVELDRDVATRFSTETGDDMAAVWSPDGNRIVFGSAREAPPFMHVKDVAGGDEKVLLPSRGTLQVPSSWSPDGRNLLYVDRDPTTDWDLWILPLDGEQEPTPFLNTPFKELHASFSPEGELVAYVSYESGRLEIYVASFPDASGKRRVSADGGYLPYWRKDGSELFYLSLEGQLMAVPVTTKPSFEPGSPISLFSIEVPGDAYLPYDVTSDGQRFIFISALPGESFTPTVLSGWSTQVPK